MKELIKMFEWSDNREKTNGRNNLLENQISFWYKQKKWKLLMYVFNK
jgi:hypothetical protein